MNSLGNFTSLFGDRVNTFEHSARYFANNEIFDYEDAKFAQTVVTIRATVSGSIQQY